MGLDRKEAKAALSHFKGDLENCVEYLTANSGAVPDEWLDSLQEAVSQTSLTQEDEDVLNDLVDAVEDVDDYDDILSLHQEREYIEHYITLMETV